MACVQGLERILRNLWSDVELGDLFRVWEILDEESRGRSFLGCKSACCLRDRGHGQNLVDFS